MAESKTFQAQGSPVHCNECGEQFPCKDTLSNHFRTSHIGYKPCPICDKSFDGILELKKHMETVHTDEFNRECLVCACGKFCVTGRSLREHIKLHTGEKQYECTVCDKTFKTNADLELHVSVHSSEEPQECQKCGKFFRDEYHLYLHSNRHSKGYECTVAGCGKVFENPINLKAHQSKHSGEKPFHCTICKKTFYLYEYLTNHMLTHDTEQNPEKALECSQCGKVFKSKYFLKNHWQRQGGQCKSQKQYECTVCHLSFSMENLEEHLIKCKREKPFECKECGTRFSDNEKLTVHMKSHSQDKRYSCLVCDFTCSNWAGVLEHHNKVHVSKNFTIHTCEVCGQCYNTKQDLIMHLPMHTSEKPYECSICETCFPTIGRLKLHMKTHDKNKK